MNEEETQRLARLYQRKHAALEALKKSLLHQAFSAELESFDLTRTPILNPFRDSETIYFQHFATP